MLCVQEGVETKATHEDEDSNRTWVPPVVRNIDVAELGQNRWDLPAN